LKSSDHDRATPNVVNLRETFTIPVVRIASFLAMTPARTVIATARSFEEFRGVSRRCEARSKAKQSKAGSNPEITDNKPDYFGLCLRNDGETYLLNTL
jgi:hypothetical protein